MKINILWLFLIIFSNASIAFESEWKLVDVNVNGDRKYIHTTSIQEKPGYKTAWFLTDYASPRFSQTKKMPYSSTKSLEAFNCQEQMKVLLQLIGYAGMSGNGAVIFSFQDKVPWAPIAPSTTGWNQYKSVCN